MSTDKVKVVVTHHFSASAERVFDAWLDPKTAGRWLFATPTGDMVRAEIDARVGGAFTFVDRRNDEDIEHLGKYLEINRPHRIVFDFRVPKFSSENTRVSIDIVPLEGGCELLLTHEGVFPEYEEPTKSGWAAILAKLAETLAS